MKNRNIPFGYCYDGGKIVIHPAEQQVLFRIRDEYLGGSSLLQIAQGLAADSVEYSSGSTTWNKAKIMRIVDDDRYLGSDGFPQIFSRETTERLRVRKTAKSTQRSVDRSSGIYQLRVPVICSTCHAVLRRVQNCKCKPRQWWECRACGTKIKLEDNVLLNQITALLNQMIVAPELVAPPPIAELKLTLEQRRLENEIARTLEGYDFDADALREKLLQRLAMHYSAIDNDTYTSSKLRELLTQYDTLEAFSPELINKVALQINLSVDGTVSISLINGQIIGKELTSNASSNATRT